MDKQEVVKCKNCGWSGLINTLLKHLRWNNECKSKYNMETLTSEQKEREKLKRKASEKQI